MKNFGWIFSMYPRRLVAIGMAGRMDVGDLVVDDVGALAGEVVFQFLYGALVARTTDEESRMVSRLVIFTYLCVLLAMRIMAAYSSPWAPVARMMRRSGGYWSISSLDNHGVFFRFEKTQLLADLDVLLHGAAFDADFLAIFFGEFDYFQHALEKGRESGDDQAALDVLYYFLDILVHLLFGNGKARVLDVGRICHEHEDIFIFECAIVFGFFVLGRHAVDVVELEVAGVDDRAPWSLDDDAHGVRNGVSDAKRI